jgi:ribonuclease G
MAKEMYISSSPHETKVAVLEDDQLVEVYFERDTDVGLVGGIYKGRVSRVLPGMQSAFVDIGLERDAFLYVSDFYEDQEEYDKVFEEAEARATKFTNQQGAGAPPPAVQAPPETSEVTAPPSAPVASEASAAPAPENAVTPPPAPDAGANNLATPVFTPHPSRDQRDRKGFDPRRGRRRRHRGRDRFGDRDRRNEERPAAPPPARTEEAPGESRSFELLPGESLAKYRNAGSEQAPSEFSPAVPATSGETHHQNDSFGAAEVAAEAEATPHATETHEPHAAVEADEAMHFTPGAFYSSHPSARTEVESSAAEAEPAPSDDDFGEVSQEIEAIVGPADEGHVESPSERAELEVAEEIDSDEEDSDEGDDEVSAEAYEGQLNDQLPVPADVAATPEGEAPAAGTEGATNETGAAPAGDRSYTLREPHQKQKFNPRRRRGRRGMGGDRGPRRPDNRRDAPRSGGNHHPVQISEVLKEGQEILVQIAKEPLGTKGARITSHVALPGRYLVYMPTISHIGVSRKIGSEEERLRLRNIIQENKGSLTGGFIVRTASQGRSEDEFKADLKFLSTLWAEIRGKFEKMKAPAMIHRDLDLVQRLLRDLLTPDFKSVRVDSEVDYERVLDFVNRCQPALVGKVKLYTRDTPLYEEFGIQAELDKALKPKVWLKSGGYIVINQTEALVAVDVNTGKYVGKTNRLEDTIVKTNVDAVNEIVRQVRLRDLGGIIVIDFIDMDERKNRFKVVQALEDALRSDRAPTKVVSFNDFGLVAITRKRVKQSLERTLCVPCTYCTGAGWVKSVNTVTNEILAEAKKMAKNIDGDAITFRVNPEVAKHLKSREGNLISELEAITKKDIIIKGDPSVHQERFEIY